MGDTDGSQPEANNSDSATAGKSDRGQRWQKMQLDQRGYTLNLVLTFTVAALAYWFGLLRDDKFLPGPSAKSCLLGSGLFLALAAASGFACVLLRLWDIHATARRASRHPKRRSQAFVGKLDVWVVVVFHVHVWSFLFAIAFLASSLLMTFGSKLM